MIFRTKGTLDNGPFGHLNGRVGNLVSYTLKGKNVVRAASKSARPSEGVNAAGIPRAAIELSDSVWIHTLHMGMDHFTR